jgi:hypothetical protein
MPGAKYFSSVIRLKTPMPVEKRESVKKTRVQFDLSPRALAVLDRLKIKTESTTYAEVICNALKLYDGLITETERDSTVMVRNKDGQIAEYKIFL